MLYADFH